MSVHLKKHHIVEISGAFRMYRVAHSHIVVLARETLRIMTATELHHRGLLRKLSFRCDVSPASIPKTIATSSYCSFTAASN